MIEKIQNLLTAALPIQALILAAILPVLSAIFALTSTTLEIAGVEGNVVFGVQQLLLRGHLYDSPNALPFNLIQYSPLYYYVVYEFAELVNLTADDVAGLYIVARAVSVAVCFLFAGLIILWMRRRQDWGFGPSLFAALIAISVLFPWNMTARPDMCYLAFLTASLFLFANSDAGMANRIIAAICFVIALWCKQTALSFLPLAVFLLSRNGIRSAISSLFPLFLFCAGSMFFLTDSMLDNWAVGLQNGTDLARAVRQTYAPFILLHFPLLGMMTWIAVARLERLDRFQQNLFLAAIYALVVGTVLGLKWGSAINYYNEFAVLSVLAAISCWQRQSNEAVTPNRSFRHVLLALYPVFLLANSVMYLAHMAVWNANPTIPSLRQEIHSQLAAVSKDSSFISTSIAAAMAVPSHAAFVAWEVTTSSVAVGALRAEPIVQSLRDREICLAFLSGPVVDAIKKQVPPRQSQVDTAILRSISDLMAHFVTGPQVRELTAFRSKYC